jgi:hypothetical protein
MQRATFVCKLNYLTVRGNLGRGEQLFDRFFITNDSATISELIDPRFIPGMGTLEYGSIINGSVVAYGKVEHVGDGEENQKIIDLLVLLDLFESSFWFFQDNCVGHEVAFLLTGDKISSNIYGGMRTFADGRAGRDINLSADQLREIVRFYRKALHPRMDNKIRVQTKLNSSRISRANGFIHRAQQTVIPPEKIAFYCSSLEALFSTSQAELSHQVAERTALISTPHANERIEVYRLIKSGYSFRSKYVHGAPVKGDEQSVISMSEKLDNAVRNCLEHAFRNQELLEAIKNEDALDEYFLRKLFE